MTYDEKIKKAEDLVSQLENAGALGAAEYQQKAKEIKQLLDECEQLLVGETDKYVAV